MLGLLGISRPSVSPRNSLLRIGTQLVGSPQQEFEASLPTTGTLLRLSLERDAPSGAADDEESVVDHPLSEGVSRRRDEEVVGVTAGRRSFGCLRNLPSGRHQASYWNDGTSGSEPTTPGLTPTRASSTLWAASSSPLGAGQANRRSQDGTRSRFTIDYEVQKA